MRFRAPVPEDAPSVLAVLVECDRADVGVTDSSLTDLLQEWRGTDVDLAEDAVVVEDQAGRLIAYAIVRRPGTMVAVSPGHEGRGIGKRLLAWAECRERKRDSPRHRQWIGGGNERAAALLRSAGYARARSYWRMVRRVEGLGAPVPVPDGVRLRLPDLGRDAVALHALDAASFAGNPDYEPEPLAVFREEHLQAHDLARELSLIAEQDGRMAGFLLTRRWEQERSGYIDLLAVHPEHRRRGLAGAMLGTAFAACAAAGLREAQLNVASDNPRALTLYERAGMSVRFRVDTYERPI